MNVTTGKFQVYYRRIRPEIENIMQINNYLNLSKAFGHWYLTQFKNIDENEIGEILIDGDGDNGIDAIIIENGKMNLYQFKFPDKDKNILGTINETVALKLLNGYKKLNSNRKPMKANELFTDYYNRVKSENIFSYEFVFVSFSDGLTPNAIDALETEIATIKLNTGNNISYSVYDKKKICDMVDRQQKNNLITLNLKYKMLSASYNIDDGVKSWTGFTTAKEILEATKDSMDVIFDENIRNYEGDNSVNQGIIKTASDELDAKNFYFYHNGIVFICDECKLSTGNQNVTLNAAAVVNGCQTVVSLKKASDLLSLQENVFIPIRIIETSDIDLRSKITEFLNSQTKIRDSYFLSNNTFIRDLQAKLERKGYFLERLYNEYNYKSSLQKVSNYDRNKILQLEKTVQLYVAYHINSYAAIAKRGKNELFNRETIDDLISNISADKVLDAINIYKNVTEIITIFRRCRRVERNDEFLNFLNIYPNNDEEYSKLMDEYIFMNTADILLLNSLSNIKYDDDIKEKIKESIHICKGIMEKHPKTSPSTATKSTSIFEEVQKESMKLSNKKIKENEKVAI